MVQELNKQDTVKRPKVTSYDSGYEHSPEHWFELKQEVEQSDEQPQAAAAIAGKRLA